MSGQMMKRVVLWEQQSSTNLNPPPPNPTSSPQHTLQQATPSDQPKRFPFVQKSVPAAKVCLLINCMLLPWRLPGCQGDDRLKVGNVASKRNSYDEAQLASSLAQQAAEPLLVSKTSSLPRNTRMLSEAMPTSTATVSDKKGWLFCILLFCLRSYSLSPSRGAEVTAMTTEAMPTQSVPTEPVVSRGEEGAKVERQLSRAESVESSRSDRSFTEESETKSVSQLLT